MGERVDSVARPARCWPDDARHFARHSCPPLLRAPAPFPLVLLCPRFCPLGVLLGSTRLLAGFSPGRVGGGGAPDAGSGPSLREFPHGGADACTPRQGVTLLYGPSICTRSVQMDLRRNQVRRPFPTPGSGTLWVSGESLRERRVSCLPRWTVCPTRSPSLDTNRSTCCGECSWSGPLATPPGRCHLGPLANGPGRNPPYCLRSGGADTDTGGAPKPLRSGTSPASFAGSCLPSPRLFAAVLVPVSLLPSPGASPFPAPLAALPGSCGVPSAPAVCPCSGALVSFVFFSLSLFSPPGVSVCPLFPPTSPCCFPAVLAPFVGGWRSRGWGGGASLLPVPWRKHVASTVQARGAALVPLQVGGGGELCGSCRRPTFPAVAPPVVPSLELARRVLPLGTVVWSVLHPLSAASPPCRVVLGGGSAFRYSHPPCRPCRLPLVARMSQARRKHDASTGRGCCEGGGVSPLGPPYPRGRALHQRPLLAHVAPASPRSSGFWSLSSRFLPLARWFALSLVFFFWFFFCVSTARRPSLPLARRSGLCPPPMSARHFLAVPAPFLGGRGRRGWGGGGAGCPSPGVDTLQARRRHEPRHLSLCRGGGLAVWLPSSPFLPCVRTPGASPAGACTARASLGHGLVVLPAPSLRCLPTLPLCPRGGGGAVRPSLPSFPTLGGAEVCGGGALLSSLGCMHVAGTTQARRRHEARHLSLCEGGGHALWLPSSPFLPCVRTPGGPPAGACTARALYGHGRVVRPTPSHRCLPTLPLCPRGGAASRPPLPASPTLGGAGMCGGGGAPMSSSPRCTHVAGTTQARRKHGVRHLAAAGGGGFLLWAFPLFSMV